MASSRPSASKMRMLPVAPNGTDARRCLQIGCQPAYCASTPKGKQETTTSISGEVHYHLFIFFINIKFKSLRDHLSDSRLFVKWFTNKIYDII